MVYGGQGVRRFPYRLSGAQRYNDWAANQPVLRRLQADYWLTGLYTHPAQAPSVPLGFRPLPNPPPDDLRNATLTASGGFLVVYYEVWENLRVIRLLGLIDL